MVVALVGDDESAEEATVKRFFREGGRVRLQPENSALEPLYPDARPGPRQGDRRLPAVRLMGVVEPSTGRSTRSSLAVLRGASLECLACGEFVLHEADAIACPECGAVPRVAARAERRRR